MKYIKQTWNVNHNLYNFPKWLFYFELNGDFDIINSNYQNKYSPEKIYRFTNILLKRDYA